MTERRETAKGVNEGHSRLGGNVLNQPLDSGFRRNDGGIPALPA